jgi:hypothetical protein
MSRIEPDASVQRQAPWPFQRARNSAEVATPLAGSGNDAPAGDVAGMRATGRCWFDRRARDHIRTRALRSFQACRENFGAVLIPSPLS